MPLYTDMHTAGGGITTASHATAPPAAGAVSATPSGHPGPGPGATSPAQLARTPRPSSGTGGRGTVVGPVVLILAALAGFAVVMTVVTGPGFGGANYRHAGHGGPVAADYVAIEAAAAVRRAPRPGAAASTGSFTARCGRNTDGHRNSDNFIVAPGSPTVRTTSTTTSATPRPTAPRPTSPSPPPPRRASGATNRSTSGPCCGTFATPARTPTAQEAAGTATSAIS